VRPVEAEIRLPCGPGERVLRLRGRRREGGSGAVERQDEGGGGGAPTVDGERALGGQRRRRVHRLLLLLVSTQGQAMVVVVGDRDPPTSAAHGVRDPRRPWGTLAGEERSPLEGGAVEGSRAVEPGGWSVRFRLGSIWGRS
jgi:hypothetical protein